ncbi:general substrate transporter [Ilyonectria sp. MPI-CAGE-AT-0026]|nr:general substrate transporter [Ilyonectria sp. MPI-CAGE-AT-0026]
MKILDMKNPEFFNHIEESKEPMPGIAINRDAFLQAQQDTLAEARSPWVVIQDNVKTCTVILVVQTNGIILGLEYVLLGALVGVQAFCNTMGSYDSETESYMVAATTLSLWAGLFGLMHLLGQLFAGWFADRFGRIKCIYLMVLNIYLGVMVEILSENKNDYTGAKIMMGTATGMMQVAVPTYIAEIAPREIRGISLGLFSFNLSLGAMIGNIVTYVANQTWGSDPFDNRAWRVPLYIGLATPTISLIGMALMIPESPYWLILQHRVKDTQASLKRLHPTKSDEEIKRLTNELQYTVLKEIEDKESSSDASYLECLRGPNLSRTFVALFPSLAQQLVGNQLVQSYSAYFFTIAGLSNALLGSVVVSCVGLGAAIFAFFLIELRTVGRWHLVFWGVIGITLSMLGIGVVDTADHGNNTASAGAALVTFVALFNAAVTIGPGVAGWSYTAESASARLRAKTATLAVGCNAVIGTVTNIAIPVELEAIGAKTGYMFFGIGLVCIVLIYLWVPDVTGRSYGQLDELFERRIPARKFKGTQCTGNYGTPHRKPA